jgi:anti-sigma B factor antagonist
MPDTNKPFSCAVVPRCHAVYVCPAGEIDVSTAPEVEARLAELHLAGSEKIVLDLSGVTFFDSCGVHLVMQWTRRSAEERFDFAVIAGSDIVEHVLQLTGVKQHLRDGAPGGRPASFACERHDGASPARYPRIRACGSPHRR